MMPDREEELRELLFQPPALVLRQAYPGNYSRGRAGHQVDTVIIHATDGGHPQDWFADARAHVSAHYVVTQVGTAYLCVGEDDTAWACDNAGVNRRSISVELEGFAKDPDMWTEPMLSVAARLVADICRRHGVAVVRAIPGVAGHCDVPSEDGSHLGGNGGHTDPGRWFPWADFLSRVQLLQHPSDGAPAVLPVASHQPGAFMSTTPADASAAPPAVPQTDPFAKGLSTSEGKLAAVTQVLTVLGVVVPTLLTLLTDLAKNFPAWGWIGPVIGTVSLVASVLNALGYANARANVKVALIAAGRAGVVALVLLGAGRAAASPLTVCLTGCTAPRELRLGPTATADAPQDQLWLAPSVGLSGFSRYSHEGFWQAGASISGGWGLKWKPASWTATSVLAALDLTGQFGMIGSDTVSKRIGIDVLPTLTLFNLLGGGCGLRARLPLAAGQGTETGWLCMIGFQTTTGLP